jgi:hypothetical protein
MTAAYFKTLGSVVRSTSVLLALCLSLPSHGQTLKLQDEQIFKGRIDALDCRGSGISCSMAGGAGVVKVSNPIRYAVDYGAVCNGTTDDRAAIQSAIDAGQGTIMLPAGTCIVGSPGLLTDHNRILAGVSRGGTELKLANGANSPIIKNKNGGGDTRVTIRDMALNGNKTNNATGQGIVGLWFVIRLESLWIYDTDQEAIYFLTAGTDQTVIDVHITYSDTIGFRHAGDGLFLLGGASEYNGVENYRLEGRTGWVSGYSEGDLTKPLYGVHIKGGTGYTVSRMQFTSETTNCIRLTGGANRNNIHSNWISNATAVNIFADPSTGKNYIGPNYTDDFQLGGITDQGRNFRDDKLTNNTEQRVSWTLPLERGQTSTLLTHRSFEDGDEWTAASVTKSFIYYRTDSWRDGMRGYKFLRTAPAAANGYVFRSITSPATGVDLIIKAKQAPLYSGGSNDGRVSVYDQTPALLGSSDRYSGVLIAKDVLLPVFLPGGTTTATIRLEAGQTNNAAQVTDWNEVDAFYGVSMNGDFERPFAAGVGENWGCFAGAVCTQETTTIYQGANSQKITGNNPSLIQQSLALTDGQLYRAHVAMYVSAGQVKCGIGDSTAFDAHARLGEIGSDSLGRWVVMEETFVKHAGIGAILRCHAVTSPSTWFMDSVAVWPVNDATQVHGAFTAGDYRSTSSKTRGTITLVAGTGTATVQSGSVCTCVDTTANASVRCAVSGTTLTATGTATDVIAYICFGG